MRLEKGPNIRSLPRLEPLAGESALPVLLRLGDDVSTDEILPAGARVLPLRSNLERIAEFAFAAFDQDYPARARETGAHAVVAGRNYGQGSSREHAALAPRSLGLRVVVAKSFARIHRQNLVNFGVLPLIFADEAGYEALAPGQELRLPAFEELLEARDRELGTGSGARVPVHHDLSPRERDVLLAGGRLRDRRERP